MEDRNGSSYSNSSQMESCRQSIAVDSMVEDFAEVVVSTPKVEKLGVHEILEKVRILNEAESLLEDKEFEIRAVYSVYILTGLANQDLERATDFVASYKKELEMAEKYCPFYHSDKFSELMSSV